MFDFASEICGDKPILLLPAIEREDKDMAEEKNRNAAATEEEELEVITLEFDDDTKMQCEIMGVFPLDDKDYIALIPQDGSDDVYLYRYQEYDDGTFELMDIDDDAQFHKVAREFDAIMAENEEE